MKKEKFLSISQYAVKCGVSKVSIHRRINLGEVVAMMDDNAGVLVIDISKYPPKPRKKSGRPVYSAK